MKKRWKDVTKECTLECFEITDEGAFIHLEHEGSCIGLREDEKDKGESYRVKWLHEDDADVGQYFVVEKLIEEEKEKMVELVVYDDNDNEIGVTKISHTSAVELGLIE